MLKKSILNNQTVSYLYSLVRRKGLIHAVTDMVYRRLITPVLNRLRYRSHNESLQSILDHNPSRDVMVLPVSIGWNTWAFQRPQQMALQLAATGYLYFYCVKPRWPEERISGFRLIAPNLYLTNRRDLLLSLDKKLIQHLYPENRIPLDFVRQRQSRGDRILYEYIDEIDERVMGNIPAFVWERHAALLRDESVYVTASADKLLNQVIEVRSQRYALVTNGVDIAHFLIRNVSSPEALKPILQRGKPIIGFYGAMAPWVDFALLRAVADTGSYSVCLIGPLHLMDQFSETGLHGHSDIHYLGPVAYDQLPSYAAHFDICTIPFLLNDMTDCVSPVKLFEYMALGKPIVTTNMQECRKYKSVVVATSHADFIAKLDGALRGEFDQSHYRFLRQEAEENSWSGKAYQVAQLLEDK